MQITGHSKESTFLSYIGTQVNKDTYADAFMKSSCYFVGSGPLSSNQFLPLLANLSRVNSSLTDFVFGSK